MAKFNKGDLIVEPYDKDIVWVVLAPPGECLLMFKNTPLHGYLLKRSTNDNMLIFRLKDDTEARFIPLLEAYSSNPPTADRP